MNNKPPAPPTNEQLLELWLDTIEEDAVYSGASVTFARRVLTAFGQPPASNPAQPPNPPATPLESPHDQNPGPEANNLSQFVYVGTVELDGFKRVPEKRWPFAESPGEFAQRLIKAIYRIGGHSPGESVMLAAVRTVLIEEPPALADWSRSVLEASKTNAKRAKAAPDDTNDLLAVANGLRALEGFGPDVQTLLVKAASELEDVALRDAAEPTPLRSALSPDALLTRYQLAEALTTAGFPVKEKTLTTKATRGGGPPFRRFGSRPLYRWADALAWAQGRLSPFSEARVK